MYTDDQIAKLLKNLGELYAENARLNLVNEVLQDNYKKLVESYDKVTSKPEEESIKKFEEKLFKEEKPKQKSKLDEQILAIQNKLKENL